MIDASDVFVHLSGKSVLEQISLTARPGELTAICGPNGSGKTTLMKAISGELPYKGSIRFGSDEASRLEPWKLATLRAVLPQSSNLSFPFTVREIIRMGLTSGINSKPEQADHIAADALQAVDLAGFEGRFYQELSGGEQQRVQFARILCQIPQPIVDDRPCWLLLDEPVSNLDISHQMAIMQLARAFCAKGGGVVAVMHDLNLTALFADHVTMLKSGRVAASGPVGIVLTDDTLRMVFGCPLRVNRVPVNGVPFVLPHSAVSD